MMDKEEEKKERELFEDLAQAAPVLMALFNKYMKRREGSVERAGRAVIWRRYAGDSLAGGASPQQAAEYADAMMIEDDSRFASRPEAPGSMSAEFRFHPPKS
jgi:hypothetical protein